MPLLEVVGMTLTGKNFTVATAFMRNEQAMTYRWVLQQIKHMYFSNTMSTENQQDVNDHEPKEIECSEEEVAEQAGLLILLFSTWLNPLAHKFVIVWTKSVMHFGVETTKRAESEHSVLKLWLSTCYSDLDMVFLHIDSLIEGQIADIKASLEFSSTKEKFNAKSNLILRMTLEIDSCHPLARHEDMDSEMRFLTDLLHQISTGPISKVREMRHLAKGILNPVLPEDLGMTLTSPPKVAVTKGRNKTNSTKRDKSYCEHLSIAHQKIQKLSRSSFGSGSRYGSGFGLGSCGRGRLPQGLRGRGRGCSHSRSSLCSIVDPSPCSTFPYTNAFPPFIYPFIENWKNMTSDGNCVYRIVADYVFGGEHQWLEIRRRMLYELEHSTNMYLSFLGSAERLGSTTVLPLYSYSDRPGGTLVIGLLTEQQHFIQLQMHDGCPTPPLHVQWIHYRSERVIILADCYYDRLQIGM
ncbi:hypothetical protein M9H77_25340 [Catharanthus roseus]|uniref:Uncharacterized protein n=1 Tax=Catharanthus roseus TaxID=4058 RepID=A0ACC0A6K9_CATRO|nr:hypothetical protein M9H77_25340 [Catharanthus roseus]